MKSDCAPTESHDDEPQTSRVQPAGLLANVRRRRLRAARLPFLAVRDVSRSFNAMIRNRRDESPISQAMADDSSSAATQRWPASDPLMKRGEYLARAGDCVACHTADKGRPFAGGLPISHAVRHDLHAEHHEDPDTGIGQWSDADFLRAMHEGIGKGGERLYPAFPYAEYTKVTGLRTCSRSAPI
jgi:mono/diheme cytochrome c family protein